MEQRIKKLESDLGANTIRLGATIERLNVANSRISALKCVNNRERLIVNALVGFYE